ncbi:MAG: NAD-dependent epimerase/dehydratase family protein [Actinomycetota bacterium]
MRLLVIGGVRFSGRALTELALARGHEVTLFHRTATDLLPDAEHVLGDRDRGVDAVAGRRFDAVVDTCGYVPRAVRSSTELLADSGWYGFISSLSAHAEDLPAGGTEASPIHEPPFPDTEEVTDESYGPLKVACEREVDRVFGDRACVIRPGFIVGPNDPTDRFTYWVRRAATGGQMLAPAPAGYWLQWVDARDLAAFVLHLAEGATPGVYGVVDRAPTMTLGGLIAEAASAAGADTRVTWVDEAFLSTAFGEDTEADDPHEAFPLWWPEAPGFHAFDPTRAFAAGLECRDPSETVRDTLAWDRTREQVWPMAVGLDPERERTLLAAVHGS